jgi:hypothetical protein
VCVLLHAVINEEQTQSNDGLLYTFHQVRSCKH